VTDDIERSHKYLSDTCSKEGQTERVNNL